VPSGRTEHGIDASGENNADIVPRSFAVPEGLRGVSPGLETPGQPGRPLPAKISLTASIPCGAAVNVASRVQTTVGDYILPNEDGAPAITAEAPFV